MKKIIFLIIAVLIAAGCARENEPVPVVTMIEEPAETEELIEEHEQEITEEPEQGIKIIEIIATENSFIPSQINLTYNEQTKLAIISNYTHNFYAPGLKINKPIDIGKTEIFIPTDRKGSYNFWCNMLHFGSQHSRMKGRISIE